MPRGEARRAFEELFGRLSALGVGGAGRFFDLTPREIEWEVHAFAALRTKEAEELGALAWLTGGYLSLALHAPGRYPQRPPAVGGRRERMTDAEMKRALVALAARGVGNDAGEA